MCPVGRTLGLSADIRTNDNVSVGQLHEYFAGERACEAVRKEGAGAHRSIGQIEPRGEARA
jgi:hypothetical protein